MKRPAAALSKQPASQSLKRPAAAPRKQPATSEGEATLQVAFVATAEHGHNTPMLALAHELRAVVPGVKLYWVCDSKEKRAAESADAEWVPLEYHNDETVGGGKYASAKRRMLALALKHFVSFSEWLLKVRPNIVIYDYFCVLAPLACQKLGVPCLCFRSGQPPEQVGSCPEKFCEAQKAEARLLKERFDVDIDWQAPFVERLSPLLNIFQIPLMWLGTSRDRYEPCVTIGPSIVPRPLSSSDESLLAAMDAPGCTYKVYMSMGTTLKSDIKDKQGLFQLFANAAKLLPEARVVLSVADSADLIDVEAIDAPGNCLIRSFIPQLAVLQRVQAFLSHCGANSLHEALWAGVPILGVPVFGDQPGNARRLEENGWGKWRRHEDLTAEMVAKDLQELATRPEYRTALGKVQELERAAILCRRPVAEKILSLARP